MSRLLFMDDWRGQLMVHHKAQLDVPVSQRTEMPCPFAMSYDHRIEPSTTDHAFDDEVLPWCVQQFGAGGRAITQEEGNAGIVELDARWVFYAGAVYFKRADDAMFFKMRWV